MPRGAPDYSNVNIDQPLHRLDDMGELCARLGSPNVYDRSGRTIWMTSFEYGLQGTFFGVDHVDSKGSLSSARAFNGAFSIKLDPRGVDESYVNWSRILHFVMAGNVGAEFAMSLDSHPDVFKAYVFYHDETEITEASLHYYPATGLWRVIEDGPAWVVVLEDFKLQTGPAAWHPIKLVLDLDKKEYVRAQIAQHVVDLSGHLIPHGGTPDAGQMEIRLQCGGSEAAHAPVYLDGIIVTQGEP